jgi:hypothetical protein
VDVVCLFVCFFVCLFVCVCVCVCVMIFKVSPLFSKNVQAIFAQISERHPFETVSVPISCFSWLGKPSNSHEYDNSRSELNLMRRVQLDFKYVSFQTQTLF